MSIKHFISVEDFTKTDYLKVFQQAKILQAGGDFSHLCRGKVLGSMFFKESVGTRALSETAIAKLGGSYTSIIGGQGSWVSAGVGDIEDTLTVIGSIVDIMIVRHKEELDLKKLATKVNIPIINGLCGGDEHALGALALVYTLWRRFPKLDSQIKLGFYGMISASRPFKALIKLLSLFQVTMYEDSIIPDFAAPAHIRKYVSQNKTKLISSKLADFISKVDVLVIPEGLPQPGADKDLVEKFNQAFKPISNREMSFLKKGAIMIYSRPRVLTNKKLTVEKEVDNHPKNLYSQWLHDFLFATMALITYLLSVKVTKTKKR
ncbi:hypothetical protein KKG58_00735 [Patescibacteria group bacterium]|nr:hypothetical protein [Patescibacteria group bacterium]